MRRWNMRYYFDLIDGASALDLGGTEYGSDEAARQEAILRSLDNRHTHQVQSYDGFRRIRVRDENNRVVCEISIDP